MEKGVCKSWTNEQEERYKMLLAGCRTFAERHLVMTVMDLLKYDGRTKAGEKAIAQGRLRLATATDKDLEELSMLESQMKGGGGPDSVGDIMRGYYELRTTIREKGITKGDLQWQSKNIST